MSEYVFYILYKSLFISFDCYRSPDSSKSNITVELFSKIIGAAVDPPLEKPLENRIKLSFNHAKVGTLHLLNLLFIK